jgi:non-heme chloroperoxidase
MPSPFDIVVRTPLWVWPILLLVLALGVYGLRPRIVSPWRLAILPLVGLGMSLSAIMQSHRPVLTGGGWVIGLLLALPAGHLLGRRGEARRLDSGRLEIAGGPFMLAFGLSIFAARYALGVLFGVLPELKEAPVWIVLAGSVGGIIAGTGLGWLAGFLVRRSTPWPRRVGYGIVAMPLVIAVGLGAMIAFSAPAPVPRLAAADTLPGSDRWNWAALPDVQRVTARDGAPLAYRLYAGPADRGIVLVHGSSASSRSMHRIAGELQKAGATVYSISLRGHGGSGTVNGDTSYKNQIDDDLADFVKAVGLTDPKVHRTLIGFSSGGGLVLREASGPNRALFDAYLAISPYIAYDSPTERPGTGGWASTAMARAIALTILDGFGLPLFQDLPVVHFATPAAPSDERTPVYSFRLMAGMQLGRDWRHRIETIDRPTGVIVGAKDELFLADRFAPLFTELNPRIAMSVVPDAGHMDMISSDAALAAVVASWHRLGP